VLLCLTPHSATFRYTRCFCKKHLTLTRKRSYTLKAIVHPKIQILSFTHSQVVPNLSDFISSLEYEKYLSGFFPLHKMKVNVIKMIITFSKYLLFCSTLESHVWNDMRLSKLWQNCSFWEEWVSGIWLLKYLLLYMSFKPPLSWRATQMTNCGKDYGYFCCHPRAD